MTAQSRPHSCRRCVPSAYRTLALQIVRTSHLRHLAPGEEPSRLFANEVGVEVVGVRG